MLEMVHMKDTVKFYKERTALLPVSMCSERACKQPEGKENAFISYVTWQVLAQSSKGHRLFSKV